MALCRNLEKRLTKIVSNGNHVRDLMRTVLCFIPAERAPELPIFGAQI